MTYECNICGKDFEHKSRARDHQRVCGISKIDEFVDDADSLIALEDSSEAEVDNSIQLNVGEAFVGRCPKCEKVVTSRHVFNDLKNLYECPKCDNIVKGEA